MFTFLNLFHPRANGVLKKNLPCLYPKFPSRPLSDLPFSCLSFLFLSAIQAKFRINPYYVVIQSFSHTIWRIQSLSFLIFWYHLVVQFTHIKNKIFITLRVDLFSAGLPTHMQDLRSHQQNHAYNVGTYHVPLVFLRENIFELLSIFYKGIFQFLHSVSKHLCSHTNGPKLRINCLQLSKKLFNFFDWSFQVVRWSQYFHWENAKNH